MMSVVGSEKWADFVRDLLAQGYRIDVLNTLAHEDGYRYVIVATHADRCLVLLATSSKNGFYLDDLVVWGAVLDTVSAGQMRREFPLCQDIKQRGGVTNFVILWRTWEQTKRLLDEIESRLELTLRFPSNDIWELLSDVARYGGVAGDLRQRALSGARRCLGLE